MNKNLIWIFGIVMFLLMVSSVKAEATAEFYYDFNDDMVDQWGHWDGTKAFTDYSTTVPSFATSGTALKSGNFDGTDDYAYNEFTTGQLAKWENGYTFSVWAKSDKVGSAYSGDGHILNLYPIFLLLSANSDKILWITRDSGTVFPDNQVLVTALSDLDTDWHHYAGTYNDNGTAILYIDGIKQGEGASDTGGISGEYNSSRFEIGGQISSSLGSHTRRYWDGLITEVKFLNFTASPTEVTALYNYGEVNVTTPPTPTEYLDITAKDNKTSASINTYNVTIFGDTPNKILNLTLPNSVNYGNAENNYNSYTIYHPRSNQTIIIEKGNGFYNNCINGNTFNLNNTEGLSLFYNSNFVYCGVKEGGLTGSTGIISGAQSGDNVIITGYDGKFYSTTNGSINTGINQSIPLFANLTFRSNNYFDQTYTDYNISTNLQGVLLEHPKITTYNNWGLAPIDYFNVTIGTTTYTPTGRTVYIPFQVKKNITINSNTTFSYSVEHDFTGSNDLNQSLKQSQVNFQLLAYYSLLPLSDFNLDLSGKFAFNTTGNQSTVYPSAGTYNAEIYSNYGDFKSQNQSVTISLLQNNTVNLYAYNYILNITALDLVTSTSINNFTINITSLNYSDSRVYSTTTGYIDIPTIKDSYTVTIDPAGFEVKNYTVNMSTDTDKEFSLYTTNSFNISFWDISTDTLITGRNITLQFIGPTNANTTTNTGYTYVDLLVPGSYTFVFSSLPKYIQNQYITTLTNRTHQNIKLYMNPENATTLVLINVRDKFGGILEDVEVTIQRYKDSAWITEQILSTDFQGRTEGQFILSTVYYNFILEYQDQVYFGIPNDNTNKKLIYAEDVSSGLIFTIDTLGGGLLGTHQDTYDIVTNLTYVALSNTTGYYRYYYNDVNNNQWPACLEVTRGGDREVVCSCESTQVIAESAIMTCSVNQSAGRKIYYAKAIFEGGSVVDTLTNWVGQNDNIDWGITGYVISFFLVLVTAFVFIKMPSFAVLGATAMFVACGMFGLIFRDTLGLMDIGIYIILLVIAFLIAKIKPESSGMEGS